MRLQINCSLKIAKYFELLLHQYGRVVTYRLRKSFTHPSSNKCDWIMHEENALKLSAFIFWISTDIGKGKH